MMALAEVDLCNMGLSNLGISQGIQSFNDQTEYAKVCAFWYAKRRDALLQSAPWNFAFTSLALASDASFVPNTQLAFPGWPFAYQYPNDCLQAIAVVPPTGMRLGPAFWQSWWWPYQGTRGWLPKIPFKVVQSQSNPGQKMVLCDIPAPVYLFYIQSVTNTALFDPLFCDTFGWDLAAYIGGPLRASVDKVEKARSMAQLKRAEALAQHLNECQQDIERVSPSVSVRW